MDEFTPIGLIGVVLTHGSPLTAILFNVEASNTKPGRVFAANAKLIGCIGGFDVSGEGSRIIVSKLISTFSFSDIHPNLYKTHKHNFLHKISSVWALHKTMVLHLLLRHQHLDTIFHNQCNAANLLT